MNLLVVFAFFAAMLSIAASVAFIVFIVTKLIGHRGGWREGEADDGNDEGGGGGRWDKPRGTPPGGGGPDRDIDRMFHEVADAIGKTIKIEKKDEEKVLL